MGKSKKTDHVFAAWTSGELAKMLDALNRKTNLIDRHFLLLSIVKETYKNRKINPEMKELCKRLSELHIQELPNILPALKKDMGGILPEIPTFQLYTTVLSEDGEYDKAIEVCKKAINFNLYDGTQSGYEGRIARIKKKIEQKNS